MSEEWKDIPGWENIYQASNFGRVRSLDRTIAWNGGRAFRRGRVLSTPANVQTGYPQVQLHRDDVGRRMHVHSLIALTFLGPRPTGYDVCHINGVRADNRPENLRYDTRAGNQADRLKHGTDNRGEKHYSTNLTEQDVRAIFSDPRKHREVAASYGISRVNVTMIKNRRTWRHLWND